MKRVSVSSTKHGKDGECEISIKGLNAEELERIEGMLNGQWWATSGEEGRLRFSPTREEVPGPAEDEEMLPFWRLPDEIKRHLQLQLLVTKKEYPPFSPSFLIQHLCGYNYTPYNYTYQVRLLESYGFLCLRSRRGDDGRYWEIWFLPGLWCAKGKLKEALSGDDKKDLEKTVSFLCKHCSFGTLDVVAQRAAMVTD